jgi:signal transduction histidine kinase/CheY-like chemotaxis protein
LANGVKQHAALLADVLVSQTEIGGHPQIARALRDDGYQVREAIGETATTAAIASSLPDLLVVDFSGPGPEQFVRSLEHHPVRSAVAVLAVDTSGDPLVLLDAGADDVLSLPFTAQSLRVKVRSLLRLKTAERTARELIHRRARDQQSLLRASQRIAHCTELGDVFPVAAEVLRANLGFDRVSIALYDSDSGMLRCVVSTDGQGRVYNLPEDQLSVNLAAGSPMLELPAYQAIFVDRHDTYYIPDMGGRVPAYFRPFLDGPVGETLLVALRTGSRDVGLVTVDNMLSGRQIGPEDAGMLLTLGHQVALAVERARLADELRAHTREVEALARVGVALSSVLEPAPLYEAMLEQLSNLLEFDRGAVLLYDDGWARAATSWGDPRPPSDAKLWPLDNPVPRWLPNRTAEPVLVPDTDLESSWRDPEPWVTRFRIRSALSLPLSVDGTVLGVLLIGCGEPHAFSKDDMRLVAGFGERTTQALRNARMYAAERERARASEELVELRTSFVESVSHELRTPLTAILGYTEILQSNWAGTSEDTRLEWIEKIGAAAGRQQRLVDDLLLLTRMEGGSLAPRIERVQVRSLAQRAAEEVQGSYRGQRIDLVGSEQLSVLADPGRALQIVTNLMDNAAKYSPEGSPIIVWWGPEDDAGVLRVLDRGPGVPANGRDHLFTRFGRVPGSRMRSGRVGTGLGLYLGRGLATTMGGDLDLESTGPEGSTFRLRLPLARD